MPLKKFSEFLQDPEVETEQEPPRTPIRQPAPHEQPEYYEPEPEEPADDEDHDQEEWDDEEPEAEPEPA